MTTATAPRLQAHLRPAKDAYDYEYFRARLANPDLADTGVSIVLSRAPLLAVPTGGARRGGYMSYDQVVLALAVRRLLNGRPGFTDLRVLWSPYLDTCHVVEWGERSPPWWVGDEAFGRFYGYSEAAIAAHLRQQSQTPSSASSVPYYPTAM
ncbi:DUF6302 family protein [Streptomyces celluloflavus]|uniref:DUF6302 family protein n=1 Tax=Streptomyces celluloflavus TaxID=58344 RepID=UPI0034600A64|nr:DUF6302 family protein [Streptomyces celluloflavus]